MVVLPLMIERGLLRSMLKLLSKTHIFKHFLLVRLIIKKYLSKGQKTNHNKPRGGYTECARQHNKVFNVLSCLQEMSVYRLNEYGDVRVGDFFPFSSGMFHVPLLAKVNRVRDDHFGYVHSSQSGNVEGSELDEVVLLRNSGGSSFDIFAGRVAYDVLVDKTTVESGPPQTRILIADYHGSKTS